MMTKFDWNSWALTATGAVMGAAGWFVRRVLTDSRRLDLLEQRQKLQHAETTRTLDAVVDSNRVAMANQAIIVEILKEIKHEG